MNVWALTATALCDAVFSITAAYFTFREQGGQPGKVFVKF